MCHNILPTAAEKKSREKNKSLVKSFIEEIFNEHNLSSFENYFGEGATYDSPYSGNCVHEFKQSLVQFFTTFPDWHTTIEHMVAEDNLVMVFLNGSGTYKGKFRGLPSTNRLVNIRSADLYKIDNERITEHWDVVDQLNLLKQTGTSLSECSDEELKNARVVWFHEY